MNEEKNENIIIEESDGNAAEADETEENITEKLAAENKMLKLELECAELGVKKEYRADVIRLSEGRSVAEVIEKYPVFRTSEDTGVYIRNNGTEDSSLRRAFGLI